VEIRQVKRTLTVGQLVGGHEPGAPSELKVLPIHLLHFSDFESAEKAQVGSGMKMPPLEPPEAA
jgi:hypothetical protein